MICVECGREAPGLIGGSCPDCFIGKNPLLSVPTHLDVEVCAHCDARHVGAHWIDPDEGEPLEWVREQAARAAIKVHPAVQHASVELSETPQDERNFRIDVRLEGRVEATPVSQQASFVARLKRSVCDRCSRMFGGYYAAVIQLRATGRDPTQGELRRTHALIGDELDRLRATGNREAFLTKSNPVPGGYDYQMGDIEGTRAVARLVSQRLGATWEETAKLVGRQEGSDVYRVTFLVRIREFAEGDFALVDDELVQVQSTQRGRAFCHRLRDHGTTKVDETRLKRLGGTELLREAVVVSQDPSSLQLLDPVSNMTKDVPRPAGYQAPDPTVWVLRYEEELYLPAFLPAGFPPPPEKKKRR